MASKQILIVEDEKPIRDMIAFGLRRAGFDVREAEDCSAARASIADQRPDLLLVDWMLPDQSGLELTRAIKRNKDTEDMPVIMLTARADEHDKVTGLEGGADDYVTKPFILGSCWQGSTPCFGGPSGRAPARRWKRAGSCSIRQATESPPKGRS